MRWSAVLEGVDVVLQGLHRDLEELCTLRKHVRIVNTLGSRCYLLATHEEIVGVGIVRIMRVKHCVEWSRVRWVPIEHVEVRVVLVSHQLAELLLGLARQVFKWLLLDSCLLQHLDALLEVQPDYRLFALERLKWVLLADDFQLLRVSLLKILENVAEHVSEDIKHLEVMLFDCHFHIESGEFAKMPVGVGVLGPEHWADLKNSVHVGAKGHLFVELRALCHASWLAEVGESEDVGTTLRGASDKLGRVDLDEIIIVEELSEEVGHAGLQVHDGLVRWHSQINYSIVESDILLHDCCLGFVLTLLVIVLGSAILGRLVQDDSRSVLNLEWQHRSRPVHSPDFQNCQLDFAQRA